MSSEEAGRCACCAYPCLAVPATLHFFALIFCYVAALACRFYEIRRFDITEDSIGIGLFRAQDETPHVLIDGDGERKCPRYPNHPFLSMDDIDVPMKTARVFAVIAMNLGLVALVLLMIPCCVHFGANGTGFFIAMGLGLFIMGVCMMFCLVAMMSDICTTSDDCILGRSGKMCIIAAVLFMMAGVSSCFMTTGERSTRQFDPTRNNHSPEVATAIAEATQVLPTASDIPIAPSAPVEIPSRPQMAVASLNPDATCGTTTSKGTPTAPPAPIVTAVVES